MRWLVAIAVATAGCGAPPVTAHTAVAPLIPAPLVIPAEVIARVWDSALGSIVNTPPAGDDSEQPHSAAGACDVAASEYRDAWCKHAGDRRAIAVLDHALHSAECADTALDGLHAWPEFISAHSTPNAQQAATLVALKTAQCAP